MRIAVFGTSGSGKTTLARRIGQALGLPVIELDAINWQSGWRDLVTHEPEEFVRRVERAAAAKSWVSDGNYSLARPRLLARATDAVWLDYPRWLVMRRVIARSVVRAATGQELWPGTGNREDWRRWGDPGHPIRWAWDTYARRRREYPAMFAEPANAHLRVHRLRRSRDADALIDRWRTAKS
jgi:adenylate kinase family enzyme